MSLRVMRRVLTIVVLVVVALLVGGVGLAMLAYPPEYVYRLLAWRNSDIGDVDRFPSQPLGAAQAPFVFPEALDPERVRVAFASLEEAEDLGDGAEGSEARLDAFLADSETDSFLLLVDGALVYEGYYNGAARDTVVTSFSMAKSITSALVGIAIAEGSIGGLDDPITRYLPELADRDAAFGAVTVGDLLRMSSGIHYEEFPFFHGDDAKTYYYPDLRRLALEETEVDGPPGVAFHYNNYHPLLLGLILERATGVPVASYLEERLWGPLGMEYDGSWSLDSLAHGFPKMESGVNGRAVDFAKFGQLYLDRGEWRGGRLVPAEWVALSTTPAPAAPGYYPDGYSADGRSLGYGLMWWTLDLEDAAGGAAGSAAGGGVGDEGGRRDFMAWGKYGQIVFVSPDNGVVIQRSGAVEGISLGRWFRLLSALADGVAE